MHCPACRASAPGGSRFCPSCGQALGDADDVTRLSDSAGSITADDQTRLLTPAEEVGEARFLPGVLLAGRYRIVRPLGRGGMGAVYLADDLRLGQSVALKFLPPAFSRDSRQLAQFHNEVRVARQITHPNVCRVYDIGDIDGQLFLSMEYIDGEDLAAVLRRRGPFLESDAVELTRQICAGLAAVHARGVLHRDLKPANIMINKAGQAQLMDFGIASAGTVDNIREGTPAYMAPEQLLGQDVAVQSDVYALGLVMHEIFTGRRVFEATTVDDLISHHSNPAPGVAARLDGAVNPRLQQAILQCLERDPSRRPASAQAVAAMLQTVLLDTHTVWRRVLQILLQSAVVFMWVGGLRLVFRTPGTGLTPGLALVAGGAVIALLSLRFPIGWTVTYKGHRIRFHNHPIWGERLYIDDRMVDRGRLGLYVTMRGTIESGEGAGERITAQSRSTFVRVACRIVAESFSAAGR